MAIDPKTLKDITAAHVPEPGGIEARLVRIESQLELIQETLTFFVDHVAAAKKKYGPLEPVAMALIRKYVVVDPKTKEPKIKLF